MHHTSFVTVELHEHVVPDFDETVAVFIWTAGRASPNMFAVVVEYFSTRTARTGVAHHPEIV